MSDNTNVIMRIELTIISNDGLQATSTAMFTGSCVVIDRIGLQSVIERMRFEASEEYKRISGETEKNQE